MDGRANEGTLLNFDGDNQRFQKSVSWTPPAEKKRKKPAQQSIFRPVEERGPTPFDEKV